ncbi:ABC transporter substrate-binding protein [Orbaceae bacterium ESL0727]|nr:ABC transporter substrate-binding protein [Orbaceae bacterium ESL0727]
MKRLFFLKNRLISLILIMVFSPCYGQNLLIATTLSTDATAHIIAQWQKKHPTITITTLNRTSSSIERLVNSPFSEKIDLIISSSPMLLAHLKKNQMLSTIATTPIESEQFTPKILQHYATAFALSGSGVLSNREYLTQHHLKAPLNWLDLTSPDYYGLLSISTPSRSDTTHIMIESLLQEYGWEKGWQILLEIGGNIGTISSRSFGVVDKINSDLSIIGITIDNYVIANNNDKLIFHRFPNNIPIPTFVTILEQSQNKEAAQQFIQYLLSPEGQLAVSHPNTGKYPVIPPKGNHPQSEQNFVNIAQTNHTQINYDILLKREAVVRQLFDIAITFRLEQLKDTWKLLHDSEKRSDRRLTEIRQLLTQMPISEAESLNWFDNSSIGMDRNAEYQISAIKWKEFFQNQNQMAMKLLENLPK